MSSVKAGIIFDIYGPYHWARATAAGKFLEVVAIEVFAKNKEYPWMNPKQDRDVGHVHILPSAQRQSFSGREMVAGIRRALDDCKPDVVVIPGWADQWALAALVWSEENNTPTILMSESTQWDETRNAWREAVKRRIVGLCSSALVGGSPHKDYMVKLGMPAERVFLGYDAVDNGYFAKNAEKLKSETLKNEARNKHGLPAKYFLASARFVEKKNLPRLIEAYSQYRKITAKRQAPGTMPSAPWDFVLLGDGVLRESLCALRSALGLDASVHLPGFMQYPDLPAYYGLASTFIHASTTEQWGLVVNEAMASSLPVLVSNRCGCALDLVQEGVNGFTFDPCNVGDMAKAMSIISAFQDVRLSEFGAESARIISNWGPERFAQGLKTAVEKSLEVGPVKPALLQRLILKALLAR